MASRTRTRTARRNQRNGSTMPVDMAFYIREDACKEGLADALVWLNTEPNALEIMKTAMKRSLSHYTQVLRKEVNVLKEQLEVYEKKLKAVEV